MDKPGGGKAVKWIIAFAFAGWAGIIALAYNLAGERISVCVTPACFLRARAAHDNILILGLTVALAAAVVLALAYSTELSRLNWRRGTKWRPEKWSDTKPIRLPDQRDR